MSRLTRLLSATAVLALLQACDSDRIAGTNNETQTKGTFFRPDGKPAVGARVRVYSASQKETDSTSIQVAQVYVDANGYAPLNLTTGYYSLMADDKTLGGTLFIDSAFSDGRKIDLPVDTLRPTGTITGHVRVQPMHSPSIAWVHLMRTNLYANVDSTGFFRITGAPAGQLDLVAVTHLPQYTPTHKLVLARPDSVIDADTIDLVYNGLPLVTGIVATYDTLSGVVTVGWKDTAYARKAGYIVYRQVGPASWGAPSERGFSESAQFRDSVFGGLGAMPSRYDSTEFDLTYWVGAKATDLVTPPALWNKVTLHVKSPALAKQWNVNWSAFAPFQNNGCNLDTLSRGVALLCTEPDENGNTIRLLHLLHSDGSITRRRLPDLIENPFQGLSLYTPAPTFWNGKIWLVRGISSGKTIVDTLLDDPGFLSDIATHRYPVLDSIRLFSSEDGARWDSTTIPTGSDQTTVIQIKAVGGNLLIHPSSIWNNRFTNMMAPVAISEIRFSAEGSWSRPPKIDTLLLGDQTSWTYMWSTWFASFASRGSTIDWTCYTPKPVDGNTTPPTFLIPGLSNDTRNSVMILPTRPNLQATKGILGFGLNQRVYLAHPETPTVWQKISTGEPRVEDFLFWHDKLVVLDKSGIHMADLVANP